MEFTAEILETFVKAKDADEIVKYAAELGFDVNKEKAEKLYSDIRAEWEICDDDLESISGGRPFDFLNLDRIMGLIKVTLLAGFKSNTAPKIQILGPEMPENVIKHTVVGNGFGSGVISNLGIGEKRDIEAL